MAFYYVRHTVYAAIYLHTMYVCVCMCEVYAAERSLASGDNSCTR